MLRLFSLAAGRSISRSPVKNSVKALMEKILSELIAEPKGWAFRVPVDTNELVDYLDFVKSPMGTSIPISSRAPCLIPVFRVCRLFRYSGQGCEKQVQDF